MGSAPVRVSVVAVVGGETMVAVGHLHGRVGSSLEVALDHDAELAPGESVVVVVHGEPSEVLLAIGLAADPASLARTAAEVTDGGAGRVGGVGHATMQRTQRLRVVEQRD